MHENLDVFSQILLLIEDAIVDFFASGSGDGAYVVVLFADGVPSMRVVRDCTDAGKALEVALDAWSQGKGDLPLVLEACVCSMRCEPGCQCDEVFFREVLIADDEPHQGSVN